MYAQFANAHRGMLLTLPNVRKPLDCDARLWATHSSRRGRGALTGAPPCLLDACLLAVLAPLVVHTWRWGLESSTV